MPLVQYISYLVMNTLNQQNIDLGNGKKRIFLFLTPNTREQNEIILYVTLTLGRIFHETTHKDYMGFSKVTINNT